ncbi:MAG TPA: M23 family metallopeptidase [Chryseolinea sp.]|nr:M23 family metallopeptidase [Chryseolinea sp.]
MRHINFHYNKETCQYEPAKLSWQDVVGYGFGLAFTASIFLLTLIFLHDRFVESDTEKVLRSENKSISKNKPVLDQELREIEATLISLKEQDNTLHTKFFNTIPAVENNRKPTLLKEQVLLADASGFESMLEVLQSKSLQLARTSTPTKSFSDEVEIAKQYEGLIKSIPSLSPLTEPVTKLISGFGKRVNPFHKGTYHHEGLDFAAPRGTDIFATADGRVILVNKATVEAGYGNRIEIDHGNGFITVYAHLENINVKQGQKISKGYIIGGVGNSGGSIAPHLHYEIVRNGKQVDPAPYLLEGLSTSEHSQLITLSKKQNQSLD